MQKKIIVLLLILGISSLSAGNTGNAAQIHHVIFPADMRVENYTLALRGTGLKWFFMVRIFIAGFYLPKETPAQGALNDVPKHLEVRYFTGIPADQLNQYTVSRMKANVSAKEFTEIQPRITLMKKYFVNLRAGDRYALTYIPGIGTKFSYNGELMGTIEGADFARALFSVWIGAKPFDTYLKRQLLNLP